MIITLVALLYLIYILKLEYSIKIEIGSVETFFMKFDWNCFFSWYIRGGELYLEIFKAQVVKIIAEGF